MCSLAAAVENVKEVLTTPGGWLSAGQGFSVRALALALREGVGGYGVPAVVCLFSIRSPHLLYPLCGRGPPRAVPSEGDLKRAAAGERVPFPPAVTSTLATLSPPAPHPQQPFY